MPVSLPQHSLAPRASLPLYCPQQCFRIRKDDPVHTHAPYAARRTAAAGCIAGRRLWRCHQFLRVLLAAGDPGGAVTLRAFQLTVNKPQDPV